MTLPIEMYRKYEQKIRHLVYDITDRIENPNPYCEDLLKEAITSLTKLLIQLKINNVDENGKPMRALEDWWWCSELKKEGDQVDLS